MKLKNEERKSIERNNLVQFKEEINIFLEQIKQVKGVENVVFAQSDGNTIESAGVWFSVDEIINVSEATSAIFNMGKYLYPKDLKYILIEGRKAKFLIAPIDNLLDKTNDRILVEKGVLNDKPEFFIAITTQPNIKLKNLFFRIEKWRKKIKMPLELSKESFRPLPIRFKNRIFRNGIVRVNTKENEGVRFKQSPYSLNLANTSKELNKIMFDISRVIPELEYAFISVEGGFIASNLLISVDITIEKLDNISAMSYSFFQTANRCAWFTKQIDVDCISCLGTKFYAFIFNIEKAIFSVRVKKIEVSRENPKRTPLRFDFLRVVLSEFSKKINLIFQENIKFKK